MIDPTAVPRPIRVGAVAASAVGIVLLAGCAATETSGSGTSGSSGDGSSTDNSAASGEATYADGSYTAEGSYSPQPGTVETISVTLTLESDVVTAVEVTGDPQAAESQRYQSEFIGGIADVVVGQDIDDLSVSKVGGSSLTSGGFNEALEQIKTEAAA